MLLLFIIQSNQAYVCHVHYVERETGYPPPSAWMSGLSSKSLDSGGQRAHNYHYTGSESAYYVACPTLSRQFAFKHERASSYHSLRLCRSADLPLLESIAQTSQFSLSYSPRKSRIRSPYQESRALLAAAFMVSHLSPPPFACNAWYQWSIGRKAFVIAFTMEQKIDLVLDSIVYGFGTVVGWIRRLFRWHVFDSAPLLYHYLHKALLKLLQGLISRSKADNIPYSARIHYFIPHCLRPYVVQ